MTLAELGSRMSNAEFELWMAESELRSHECPSCGLEPKDLKESYQLHEVTCPFCRTKYQKVRKGD